MPAMSVVIMVGDTFHTHCCDQAAHNICTMLSDSKMKEKQFDVKKYVSDVRKYVSGDRKYVSDVRKYLSHIRKYQ